MKIREIDLGVREIARLTSFIQLMLDSHPSDCVNCIFDYSSYYDEPCIITENNGTFYSSDYDIGFDRNHNAEFI